MAFNNFINTINIIEGVNMQTKSYYMKLRDVSTIIKDMFIELLDIYDNFYSDHFNMNYRIGDQFGNEIDEIYDMARDIETISDRIKQIAIKHRDILDIKSPYYR